MLYPHILRSGAAALVVAVLTVPTTSDASTTIIDRTSEVGGEQMGPGVAAGAAGHVYFGSTTGAITERDSTGAVIRTVATAPHPVSDLVVDASGGIYATGRWWDATTNPKAPRWKSEVWAFAADGTTRWTASSLVGGTIALAGGSVWVGGLLSDFGSVTDVYGYSTTDGTATTTFPIGAQPVRDLATMHDGNLVVATDTDAAVYTPSGAWVRNLSDFGALVDVGPSGDLYGAAGRAEGGTAGPHSFQLHRASADGQLIGQYETSGSAVDLAVGSDGVVWLTGYKGVALTRIDPSTPDARLTASTSVISTGQVLSLDASASTATFDSIASYQWDLNGDGTYETSPATTPTAQTTFVTTGQKSVGVVVRLASGGASTARVPVEVRLASPSGLTGVTMNAGATYTNNPNVTLSPRWPDLATAVLVSNDGGFASYRRFPVATKIPWMLIQSGEERLPKTIYLRFRGGASGNETYQDDIILDQTRPTVVRASATRVAASTPTCAVRVRGADATSGVNRFQLTRNRSYPGQWRQYGVSRGIRAQVGSLIYVRVGDRAKNRSVWKAIRCTR